jgi:hypothetical protein
MNLLFCFNQFLLLSIKLTVLKKIFCNKIVINPIPNSTADSTRKKNVNDSKFMLSYKKPTLNTIMYKVIHNNSAVNSKCSALDILLDILSNIKKNRIKYKFKSPINKKYKFYTYRIESNNSSSSKDNKTKLKNLIHPNFVK